MSKTSLGTPATAQRFGLVGRSPAMREFFTLLARVARSDVTVLIQGEHGTGKERCARAIHEESPRGDSPFVAQHAAAFNEGTADSELFGHVKGAFTGAQSDKKGLFALAHGGTFFLDEVAGLSLSLQVKLLRVLQEGTFFPVGSTRFASVDVRFVTATQEDLWARVRAGSFREDLFYRLHVLTLHVPPLRERTHDVSLLCRHFLLGGRRLSRRAQEKLEAYTWPGNVRELLNEMTRLNVMTAPGAVLSEDLLSPHIRDPGPSRGGATTLPEAVEALEREWIEEALAFCKGNKSRAAKALGISRRNLIRKCTRYGLG